LERERVERGRRYAHRANRLLRMARGVTRSYATAALAFGLVEWEELRGAGNGKRRRFYLA
jgi:hypothetical protein